MFKRSQAEKSSPDLAEWRTLSKVKGLVCPRSQVHKKSKWDWRWWGGEKEQKAVGGGRGGTG